MSKTLAKTRKIAVLGSRAVGKSTVTVQFVEGHFVETYYPTIESTFNKTIAIGGGSSFNQAEYALEIVDTAGHDEYSLFSTKHAMGIHGYVLVYSITNRQSFELIQLLRDKILNYTGVDWVPIIIVGNKADLHSQRQISKEEGAELAREWKCSFIEASAKTNLNITKIFETLVIEIEKSSGDGGAFQQQQKTASGSGGGVGRSSSSSAAAAASSAKGGSGQLVGPDGEKLKECIIL